MKFWKNWKNGNLEEWKFGIIEILKNEIWKIENLEEQKLDIIEIQKNENFEK